MRKIMSVLDIGNDTIKLVIGEMVKDKLNVLAISEIQTLGITKSLIQDEDKLTNKISESFKNVNEKLGLEITKTIVSIRSDNLEFSIGEAKIGITSEDNIIDGHDITKAITESYTSIIPDNMELINVMPTTFKLDDGKVVKNPLNETSTSLYVKSIIVMSPKDNVYPILSILEKLNIDIVEISVDAIGDYYTFRNKEIDKENGAIINIGHYKTNVSIFSKGILTNSVNIKLGGLNIINDISYVYKIDKNISCELLKEYGIIGTKLTSQTLDIDVKNKYNENITIDQIELSRVIEERLKEILYMVKKELNYLTKKDLSYIIITGGTSETKNFLKVVDDVFGKMGIIGTINEIGARNNKYSSALGLIKWYNSKEKLINKDYSILSIDEQGKLSGVEKESVIENNSVIKKVFDYFFD